MESLYFAVLDEPRTHIKFSDDEDEPPLRLDSPLLGYLEIDLTSDPTVRKAATYVGDLYVLLQRRIAEYKQASESGKHKRIIDQLRKGPDSSETETSPRSSNEKLDEIKHLFTAVEALTPVVYLMRHNDCSGEVFDNVVDRIKARPMFTTEYEPLAPQ